MADSLSANLLDFVSFGRRERESGSIAGAARRQQCESLAPEYSLGFAFASHVAS